MAISKITSSGVATDAITASQIAAGAVGSSEIATDAVTASELANDAVDTAAIATGAVTAAKVAADVATQAELDTVKTRSTILEDNVAMLGFFRASDDSAIHSPNAGMGAVYTNTRFLALYKRI